MKDRLKPIVTALFSCLVALALTGASVLANLASAQQVQRVFPAKALRGSMTFVTPNQVLVSGHSERLGPGVRVRNQQNRTVFPSTLRGQTFTVNYLFDASGHIDEVWILNAVELKNDRRATGKWADQYDSRFYVN